MSPIKGSYDWIRDEATSQITKSTPFGVYVWVKDVFPDSLVVEVESDTPNGISSALASYPYTVEDTTLTLGEPTPVALDYVATKRREIAESEEEGSTILGGPLAVKDAARRLVTGAVLVPGETDAKDEPPLTPERIEEAAHEWMRDWRYSDRDHDFGSQVAVPVESYTLPEDMAVKMSGEDVVLPAGSWVVTSYVTDDAAWKDVQNGTLTGYSIAGIRRSALEAATKSGETVALKSRTRLADLGEDWISGAVSLVGQPAVPKGTWFAIKSHTEAVNRRESARGEESREVGGGFWSRLLGLKGSENVETNDKGKVDDVAEITKEDVQRIVKEEVGGAVVTALKDAGVIQEEKTAEERLNERLDAIEAKLESPATAEKSGEETARSTGEETAENVTVTFTAEDAARIERLLGKTAVKSNGAGRSAPKETDAAPVAEKFRDEDDGRDALGRSTKKVFS